jgi:S-adenosylmethionine-dependent methyltransferase
MKAILRDLLYPIPPELRMRHTMLGHGGADRVRRSLHTHFHQGWRAPENYSEAFYQHDVEAHLYKRLINDRRLVVPWLSSARSLRGLRVVEIGCGTGSSTVALAEQGAHIVALDIDQAALEVAQERCRVHGVSVEFRQQNAQHLLDLGRADAVIYFAVLEHMKHEERLQSLKEAWELLPAGGLLAIIETPNRLWLFDHHTSQLPFFNWLPDELAFAYSRFSPKEIFKDSYREPDAQSIDHFRRRGRGISYHEIDVAIAPTQTLETVSSLGSYFGWRLRIRTTRFTRHYKALLRSLRPDLHEGWFDPNLDLIIRKH